MTNPKPKSELAKRSARLKRAIRQFIKDWDEHVERASPEHQQLVRDDIADALFQLQRILREGKMILRERRTSEPGDGN